MMDKLKGFIKEESGQGMVEYGLIMALIAVVVIGVVGAIGSAANKKFKDVEDGLKK